MEKERQKNKFGEDCQYLCVLSKKKILRMEEKKGAICRIKLEGPMMRKLKTHTGYLILTLIPVVLVLFMMMMTLVMLYQQGLLF